MQNDDYFPEKNSQKIFIHYDTAFRKPQFSRHSDVFEDNVSSFKDESSPNLLSTAASSLSSLTIDDDDDYPSGSDALLNKAGLIKSKSNKPNTLQAQRTTQDDWRQHSTSHTPLIPKSVVNNERVSFSNYTNQDQKHDGKTMKCPCTDCIIEKKEQEASWNRSKGPPNRTNRCYNKEQMYNYNHTMEEQHHLKRLPSLRSNEMVNLQKPQCNRNIVINSPVPESSNCEDYITKARKYKQKQETTERENIFHTLLNPTNEMHSMDETSDIVAYEEQLLDQCIRKGMAKVTKRNINEIRPFSWDFNQICLTTRIMLRNYDEDIKRDKKDDYRKHCISHKQTKKHL